MHLSSPRPREETRSYPDHRAPISDIWTSGFPEWIPGRPVVQDGSLELEDSFWKSCSLSESILRDGGALKSHFLAARYMMTLSFLCQVPHSCTAALPVSDFESALAIELYLSMLKKLSDLRLGSLDLSKNMTQ